MLASAMLRRTVQKAVLSWKCLACQENRALLEVELETGRFHQIRVQMAHAGMPLLGDQRYGSEESREVSMQLGIRTIRLQAVKLAFCHPTSGKEYVMSLRTNLRFESKSAVSWLTALWIFLMTAVFPYYMKNHYSQMGVRKFSFFLTVSLVCLIPAGVLAAGSREKPAQRSCFGGCTSQSQTQRRRQVCRHRHTQPLVLSAI